MRTVEIIASIILLFQFKLCSGQSEFQSDQWPYTVNHYTDESGLPQNSVKSIVADKSGFIWLATESGLARFDGQSFYTFDKNNTSLRETRFFTIQPGIGDKGMHYYAIADHYQILRIEKSVAVRDTLFFPQKLSLLPHFKDYGKRVLLAMGVPNYSFDFNNPDYYIILNPQGNGDFFVVKSDEIQFFSNNRKKWSLPFKSNTFGNFFSLKGNLYQLSASGQIIGFSANGLDHMRLSGEILKDPDYNGAGKTLKLFWNNISDQSFILLGNRFYYLEKRDEHEFNTRLILEGFNFQAKNIRTVYYNPQQKKVFLGSISSGLYVFSKKDFKTLRSGERDMDNVFYAEIALDSGKVITPNGAILGLTGNGLSGRLITKEDRDFSSLIKANYRYDGRSMLKDRNGHIWSKSYDSLFQYDASKKVLKRSLGIGNEIKCIYEQPNGRIWIGTRNEGLFYIDSPGQQPKRFPTTKLPTISYLLEATSQLLWVASEHGLYLVNLASAKCELIAATKNLNIRSLHISPSIKNGIFLTTYEDGVFLYKDNKLVQFPLDVNRYLSAAHCMVEDRKGFLWIPTNNGLFQAAKSDLLYYASRSPAYGGDRVGNRSRMQDIYYMYYAKDQGFYTNEFNGGCQPCAVQLDNGYVSLPSLNGLVWFKPDDLHVGASGEALIIDRFDLQGATELVETDTVKLPLHPKQISFHVAVPYFGNRYNLHLYYALLRGDGQPVSSDWIPLKTGDPVIRFSELGYGDYSLIIRKVNGFGTGNDTIKRITIIVPPAWYETWWLRVLCFIGVLAAVYLYTLFRTAYFKKRNAELEAQIAMRTNHLQKTLLALQTSEKELSRQMHIQTRLIASVSHDVRTPLKFIVSSANRIESYAGKKDYTMIEMISKSIMASGAKMSQFLENTIGYIKTQVYGTEVHTEKVFLFPVIQEKLDLFLPVIKEQANQVTNRVEFDVSVKANPQLLGIVVHNLIDNACKYAFEGQITVGTEHRGENLHLVISDSGLGMPEVFKHWLNSEATMENAESLNNNSQEYSGLGLLIVKEILAIMGVSIWVENENGTSVHLIFKPASDESTPDLE
jgi:signal transduction histidine kinase